jgi:hypothetical protein
MSRLVVLKRSGCSGGSYAESAAMKTRTPDPLLVIYGGAYW